MTRTTIFHILMLVMLAFPFSAFAGVNANWCAPPKPPTVDVKTDTDRITWVYDRSEKVLDKQHIDTVNPYGNNVITDVGGLMQGGIRMAESMRFGTFTNPNTGQSCMYYDSVSVEFHIFPTIFIASEHAPGTCLHNAIKFHEMKHINVDRDIVNRYAAGVGKSIQAEIQQQGIYGPFPTSNLPATQSQMKARMESILTAYSNGMDNERRVLQQQVDSLQEYERVNHFCDNRPKY